MRGGMGMGARLTWIAVVVSALVFVGLPASACAAGTETRADVRCLLIALHTATLNLPQERTAGTMAAIYYLGLLDGHSPHANIEQLIKSEARKMTPAELRAESARCAGVLERKGHELQKIGAALSREARGAAASK